MSDVVKVVCTTDKHWKDYADQYGRQYAVVKTKNGSNVLTISNEGRGSGG